jgi:AcrR family transcriptional regulator
MLDQQPQRRDLILKAVMDILAIKGQDGVTLRQVAKKAGVSLGLISYHYKTRSELFRATLDWILEQFEEVDSSLAGPDSSARTRLNSFFLRQEKLLAERTELLTAWFIFVTLGRSDRWLAARIQESYVERVETVRGFLKEMMDQGAIRPDLRPGLTAEDLVASVEGMGLLWLNRIDKKGIAAHRRRAVNRWTKTLGL